jgi:hypothetical protein
MRAVVFVSIFWLCVATAAAQQTLQKLTNVDIIKMTQEGFSEGVIVAVIEQGIPDFDVSVTGLTALKNAGISNKVMEAMLKARAGKHEPAEPVKNSEKTTSPPVWSQPPASATVQPGTQPPNSSSASTLVPNPGAAMMPSMGGNAMVQQVIASMMGGRMPGGMGAMSGTLDLSQLPPVTLENGNTRQMMKPSIAQVASTQTKGDGMPGAGSAATGMMMGLGRQALSFGAIGGGMFAGPGAGMALSAMGSLTSMGHHHGPPKVTYVWALPGPQSSAVVSNNKPRFEMEYGNLLGIDPDAYEPFIVKIVPSKDNWRLIGATKSTMGQLGTEAYEKVTEVRVKSKYERLGRGQVRIEPTEALPSGEYGIVLRAIHPGKRAQGSLGGPAEQTVFFSVWDFSVQ